MIKYKGVDPYGHKVEKTENQLRAWLDLKLKNYLWKIKGTNSYGSKKKLQTISNDLFFIIQNFNNFLGIASKQKITKVFVCPICDVEHDIKNDAIECCAGK